MAKFHPVMVCGKPWSPDHEVRVAIERAYERSGVLLGDRKRHWLNGFRREFPQRAWELFLADRLNSAEVTFENAGPAGPDFVLRSGNGHRIAIEAIAPNPPDDHTGPLDRELLLSRYTSALLDKAKKVSDWTAQRTDLRDVAHVIAICADGLAEAQTHDVELPLVVSALTGFERTWIDLPVGAQHESTIRVSQAQELRKRGSGAKITLRPFSDPRFDSVAAVLFVRNDPFTRWVKATSPFGLVHNPNARQRLPLGSIEVLGEYYANAAGNLCLRGTNLATFPISLPSDLPSTTLPPAP
jgi:hypothetical protein